MRRGLLPAFCVAAIRCGKRTAAPVAAAPAIKSRRDGYGGFMDSMAFPFRLLLAVGRGNFTSPLSEVQWVRLLGCSALFRQRRMRMKQMLVLAAMLFSGLLVVPQANAAVQFGRGDDRVCLYQRSEERRVGKEFRHRSAR